MTVTAAYRFVVLMLWSLAAYGAVSYRGLFWDGASFLVNVLDLGEIHDFYTARAHVDWVTQLPVLLLAELGVRDTRLLAAVYSAALVGLPTALYHLALARTRHDAVQLGTVVAAIAVVYLPTSFFLAGEYNAAFAAALAAMAVTLGQGPWRLADAVLVLALGLLAVRSYESMVYLGPLLAAAIAWSLRRGGEPAARLAVVLAALAFVAAAAVALVTIVDYWSHPHFVKVLSMSFDFWQNLQFVIPLVGLAIAATLAFVRPRFLEG
ncbi:MAG: hypothetical protein FJX11_24075, partial [Alphaproteobacteria bacterium]|nr:hypothetical protein [Alphaproteobacteria bacterium]